MWTAEETRLLRELYPHKSRTEVAAIIGRTAKAIASRAKVLGIRRLRPNYRRWTAVEDRVLRKLYPHRPTKEIGAQLGRTFYVVYQRAAKLGLKKSAAYMASPAACRLRRGDKVGWAYRYPKGHVPANKGLRRPGWAPGRMAETQFKKGIRSGIAAINWCPIGSIRPDAEGYLRIKVREGRKGEAYGFGNVKIWPLLNRHVWAQHHGPIPAGHIVTFKDRNRANCTLENLELRTLAENMKRNTVHRLPKELAQVIQLTGALKRKIRNREKKANGEEHTAGPAGSSVRDAGSAHG